VYQGSSNAMHKPERGSPCWQDNPRHQQHMHHATEQALRTEGNRSRLAAVIRAGDMMGDTWHCLLLGVVVEFGNGVALNKVGQQFGSITLICRNGLNGLEKPQEKIYQHKNKNFVKGLKAICISCRLL